MDLLQTARTYDNDRLIYGVGRVYNQMEDVEGDWLEKWGEEEDNSQSIPNDSNNQPISSVNSPL